MLDSRPGGWRGRAALVGGIVGAGALLLFSSWRSDRLTLTSRVLDEQRSVLVRLPPGYGQSGTRYPALYLLDGGDRRFWSRDEPLFSRASELLDRLEGRVIPEMILVGVANRDRVRDLTPVGRPDLYVGGGAADAFLRFLAEELVPFIDGRFRTSRRRILYGESYGGLFALYALAERPDTFTDYIAVSPAVGVCSDSLATGLARRFASEPDLAVSLFVASGESDAPLVTEYVEPLLTHLEPVLPARLRLGRLVVEGAGHNPPDSLREGLRFVWQSSSRVPGPEG